ncbi:hypothetical protein GCM10010994_17030 [Chelatococcus reniformis]|uniref:Uncharacterized protein n=1 Tax=Chelatococcus reniformis TaxID=1494448 RepID=A0A916U4A0_9HYPH|nr:hypothetical protein GCM10010994_17030 [Chelatococcus reniformis]
MHTVAEPLQRARRGVELALVLDLEGHRLVLRIAFHIAERMGPVVGAQVERLGAALRHLQTEAAGGERLRLL